MPLILASPSRSARARGPSDRGTSLILTLYDGFRKEMGGQQELDKFARLFMVPGMGRCGGGPSPNCTRR